jgi:fructokinase
MDRNTLEKIIDTQAIVSQATVARHSQHTVVIFGEVLFDDFPDGAVLGGAPFNVAWHLQAFGMHPVVISRTGNDMQREQIIASMQYWGMDTLGIQSDPLHPTGRVSVHEDEHGHHFEILPEQAYDYIHPTIARMVELSVHPRLLYYGTLAQRNKVSRRALAALLRSASVPRLLDLNLRAPWYDTRLIVRSLETADIVKLSNDELATLAKTMRLRGDDQIAHADALVKRFQLERILVTCGAEGAWLLDKQGMLARESVKTTDIEVIDTVGAGDAFSAVYITGMLLGWPIYITMSRASAFASAVCGVRGATPQDPRFYEGFKREWGLH